jgi:hypothetical protein
MQLLGAIASASVLVGSVVALPAGFQALADSASWTEPAGAAGSTTAELAVTSEFFGIQALKAWDFDGRACSLQIEQSSFNAPSLRPLDAARFCEPKQAQSWKRADIGNGQYVTGISVCSANKDPLGHVHGVELWGASLEVSGKLKPAKQSVKLELPHCEKWSPKRVCPAGKVATAVRAQLADANEGVVGLALRCQTIKADSNERLSPAL